MNTRYFEIGDDDWGLLLVYDYTTTDYDKLWALVRAFGLSDEQAQAALSILSKPDTGMTLTGFNERMSVLFVSGATSDAQWFDTLIHEVKHVVEHISEYYDVDPKGEPAAYLQGEIGRQLFPVIINKICNK